MTHVRNKGKNLHIDRVGENHRCLGDPLDDVRKIIQEMELEIYHGAD